MVPLGQRGRRRQELADGLRFGAGRRGECLGGALRRLPKVQSDASRLALALRRGRRRRHRDPQATRRGVLGRALAGFGALRRRRRRVQLQAGGSNRRKGVRRPRLRHLGSAARPSRGGRTANGGAGRSGRLTGGQRGRRGGGARPPRDRRRPTRTTRACRHRGASEARQRPCARGREHPLKAAVTLSPSSGRRLSGVARRRGDPRHGAQRRGGAAEGRRNRGLRAPHDAPSWAATAGRRLGPPSGAGALLQHEA
mmetsp:Transcript_58410/g.190513  ORF Transcript_58410/g.190513 Transcript_58410/m.190513 type:complete len:254 (-) Transcript_58410:1-762(-)